MSILDQLSSQVGDRSEKSNLRVVVQCVASPALLDEIVQGLKSSDAALVGDCAEVMTKLAEEKPEWIAPYAKALAPLVAHKTTRARWEAIHALALTAALAPKVMAGLLPSLAEIIRSDSSVIARDYAVDALGNYASVSAKAARAVHPILVQALAVWGGKHAAHALRGLGNVALAAPDLAGEVRTVAFQYHDAGRGVVRKAARTLLKTLDEM